MDKKTWLDKLHYEIDKQQGNLELAYAYLDNERNPKFTQWKRYLDCDEEFIKKANNRTILLNEIVLDIEEPEKFKEIFEEAKKEFVSYSAYKTGSKGYHIHLWFAQDLTQEEKLYVIKKYNCDEQKATSRCMIALENCPHWKTGNMKTLIEEKEGLNKKVKVPKLEKKKESKVSENENNFNYDSIKPEKEIDNIEQLKEIIIKNFPTIWFETKACLSVYASMSLKNLNGCPSLNLIGNPSGEKTTALSFFYGQTNSYLSDDFTPRAFVSHSANVPKEELGEVDLLPKLQNRVLLTPELAPLFEAPKEKLLDNFAILTRVLDGEGLNRDSGVHGHRGYSGDYKFGWIGASTPLRSSVWSIMGKIGNRLFFLNMNEKNRTDEDFIEMFMGESYEEKIKECRGAVQNFLNNFYKKYPLRSLKWENKEQDVFVLKEIIKYAKLLSRLRGSVVTWNTGEEGKLGHNLPIIEEPPRAINSLLNFAKGHALSHEREYLIKEDLELVRKICLSSMPYDRFKFLELLIKHEGRLTTEVIEKELNCSKDTALRTMQTFEILGVVKIKSLSFGQGRPSDYIELEPEFNDLLKHTQVVNPAINVKSQETNPVPVNSNELNLEDLYG